MHCWEGATGLSEYLVFEATKAERESLRHVLDSWKGVDGGAP